MAQSNWLDLNTSREILNVNLDNIRWIVLFVHFEFQILKAKFNSVNCQLVVSFNVNKIHSILLVPAAG